MSLSKIRIEAALSMVLVLFFAITTMADTLISSNDIHYHSDFEKQVFTHHGDKNSVNYIALYLAADADINTDQFRTIEKDFNELVSSYQSKKFHKLKDQKKVKKIYEDVHKAILDKYDQKKSFSSIFLKGEYQCVTASMLYSLIFDALDIPFEIKLLPTHSYLIAYPDEHYILVETTEPIDGTIVFDDRFKTDYVNYMREHKLIGKDEFDAKLVNELFDLYYMQPETIDLFQLAGAQYYNLSLLALENRKYFDAYHLMEKAYYLYPSAKNSFMLLFALSNVLNRISITDVEYAEYLGKLMRFQDRGITADQLFGLFTNLTNRQLLFDGNVNLYDDSYNIILPEVKDSTLLNNISFLYNYERGRVLYLNSEYDSAEQFIGQAFSLKPKSADVKAMFYGIMLAKMEELKSGDDAYTLSKFQEYFNTISIYKKRFTHLNDMRGFRQAWLYFCLGLMDQFYQFQDSENGEKYRMIFESDYPKPVAGFSGINNGISDAYSSAANYYHNKKQMAKTLEVTAKGLEYIPDNNSLLQIKNKLN